MKTNKLWKRFWTLNVHDHAGFTLVELIVVIAILAILAAVAVPAYSGYIEKTNKTLDETLISEVKRAIELAYYTGDISVAEGSTGYVAIGPEGVEPIFSDAKYEAAVLNAFGSKDKLTLKYDGWQDTFNGSNLGKIAPEELLGEVEGLTNKLSGVISNLVGTTSGFKAYASNFLDMTEEQLAHPDNAGKVADAAVMYAASENAKIDKSAFANIGTTIAGSFDSKTHDPDDYSPLFNVLPNVTAIYGGNLFLGTAASYAMMMGFCEYAGVETGDISGVDVSQASQEQMTNLLAEAFAGVAKNKDWTKQWEEYLKKHAADDLAAFVDVMGTVNSAEDQIKDELITNGSFTTGNLANLFGMYSKGGVIIEARIENGVLVVE